MKIFIIVAFLAMATAQETADVTLTSIVNTTLGPVQGYILKTIEKNIQYAAFKGIPYAEPPTGYRRFKPPVEKSPWPSTLLTVTEGSVCHQRDRWTMQYVGSEDCLYLNVYTPRTENLTTDTKNLLHVMVWIHGGAYVSGHSNSSYYGPDFLIEEGIILVTFNFRLGPLGFLNLNHENATGNAGLKDQSLALKWTKENIINFGGNPRSITIFGLSSGAASVDLHVLSNMSRGLFHKSISMSGAPLCPWAFQNAESALIAGISLGNKLGVNSANKHDLLRTLYNTSATEMTEIAWEMGQDNSPFKPSVENSKLALREEKFITECIIKIYERGEYYKGPHLMGFSEQEALYLATSPDDLMNSARLVMEAMKSIPVPPRITRKVFPVLSQNITDLTSPAAVKMINVLSDLIYIAGIEATQKYLVLQNTYPVYYYRTTVAPEFSHHKVFQKIDIRGAAHGDDLSYVFYVSVANPPLNVNNTATIARKRVVKMWSNFAKYGLYYAFYAKMMTLLCKKFNFNPLTGHLYLLATSYACLTIPQKRIHFYHVLYYSIVYDEDRNPTPRGKADPLLKITWPSSGISGKHLIIGEKLSVINRRPIDFPINEYRHLNVGLLVFRFMC